MTFKKKVVSCIAICISAILMIAVCGCEDLGEYESTEEYYDSFGVIVLINGTSRESKSYSVKDYFYNEDSREDFLKGDDGVYKGVEHSDYVYIAIPFEKNIEIDSLALYVQSRIDTTVYMNVYLVDKIPSQWKGISDIGKETEISFKLNI